MTDHSFDYAALMREALQRVVRRVLEQATAGGLPGSHHFYLSFRTDVPGVEVPDTLRQRYPEEMTVVLQHQYWDLEVGDDGFGVTLAFSGIHQRIVVPWSALLVFYDPSVPFGLRFDQLEQPIEPARAAAAPAAEPESEARERPGSIVHIDQFRKKEKT
jgi:hypothetical protein